MIRIGTVHDEILPLVGRRRLFARLACRNERAFLFSRRVVDVELVLVIVFDRFRRLIVEDLFEHVAHSTTREKSDSADEAHDEKHRFRRFRHHVATQCHPLPQSGYYYSRL